MLKNGIFPEESVQRKFLRFCKRMLFALTGKMQSIAVRFVFSHKEFVLEYCGYDLYYSFNTSIVKRYKENGCYEPEEIAALTVCAARDSRTPIFLDIGANIGMISLAMLRSVPDMHIYAFEPGPHQFSFLRKNVSANGLSDTIRIFDLALSNVTGTASFSVHDAADASGDGLRDTGRAGGSSAIQVRTETLDNWWRDNACPQVSLIKIDVEGAELLVIQGASALMRACRPVILFEIHATNLRAYDIAAETLLDSIRKHDYTINNLDFSPVSDCQVKQLSVDPHCGYNFIASPTGWPWK